MSAIWIERWPVPAGPGPVVAVKDLIDVEGSPTTAGCRAVAMVAEPAIGDAVCIRRVRSAGGRLAGKANLHELAYGTSGINPWFGTPVNPADPGKVPGGSSSGSAVAVAVGEADVGLGTDTGGSVRIPAACCAVVGLKTTWGRIPVGGVWPLAPSLDTVGPLARDVAGVVEGMRLLEGGFVVGEPASAVGLLSLPGVEIDPVISGAVADALAAAELDVASAELDGWLDAWRAVGAILDYEAWEVNGYLLASEDGEVGAEVAGRLQSASKRSSDEVAAARTEQVAWARRLGGLVERHGVLALPTIPIRPPEPEDFSRGFNLLTSAINLAGLPALSLPVPVAEPGRPPASLQLVGPSGGEELLCAVGARVEAAVELVR